MIGRIIETIRWAVYGLVLYNTVFINWWIAIGFAIICFHIEVSIYAITILRRQVRQLEKANAELKDKGKDKIKTNPQFMDFGYEFSSEPLTEEEEEYIDDAEKGNIDGVEKFLASRCKDKTIDFTTIPLPVKLIMTAKVMAIVKNGSQNEKLNSDWDDVIIDDTSSDNN